MPDISAAVDEGWTPAWWIDEDEQGDGPACPDCSFFFLEFDAEEPRLLPGIALPTYLERRLARARPPG
jgi:hypothetical protein